MPQFIQRSLTGGEISPSLQSRADITKYATGLNLCQNFFIRPQGGVYSRGGLRYVGAQSNSAKQGRLIPFSFNTEQTYILLFEDLTMRVIKNGGFVLSGGVPYELTTTYTEAELPYLGYTQSADVMTLTHPNHDPTNLNRLADDNWTLTAINYASTVTAPTISSVAAVGTGAGSYNKNYTYVVTAVNADGIESLASGSSTLNTLSLSVTAGVRITWGAVTGAQYYRIYKDPSDSTGIFGWIGDSNGLTFDDFNLAPITSDAPPQDRTPFTGAGNKPSTVTYYQQRQVFGNTTNEPQAVYTTQTGNFNSLRTSSPARDDDAVTFTIAAQQVNEIRHLIALNSLVILTSGGEWVVSEGQNQVLTPSTIGARPQSYNGASWVKPVIINSTALYLQKNGKRIRDLAYQFANDSYTGNDLAIMAQHLFKDYQITDMDYANEPDGILWCVRNDGMMVGLTYQKEHEVWGWHRHITAGEFESVAVITESNVDVLYVIVKRVINGSTVRYVERLEQREEINAEDAFCVDSGLSYIGVSATITGISLTNPVVVTVPGHPFVNGDTVRPESVVGTTEVNDNVYTVANATTDTVELSGIDGTAFTPYVSGGILKKVVTALSGLDHLEGEQIVVLADGNVVEGLTVSAGAITLPRAANKVHAGLSYLPAIELLDIDTPSPTQTIKSQEVSVSQVTIEFEASRGGFIGGRVDPNSGNTISFREIKPRFDTDAYNTISLKTYKASEFIDPMWEKGGGVRIEQRVPLPMAILSVIPKVDIGGS